MRSPRPASVLYLSLLGREPSPEEAAAVRRRLAAGVGIEELADELTAGEEYAARNVAQSREGLLQALRADWQSPVTPRRRLVFLHIMKVGGTSLGETLSSFVPPGRALIHAVADHLVLQPRLLTARLDLISGHLPYEALSLIPGHFTTLCVLRDPVERTISHYAELRRNPAFSDLSVDRFLSDELFAVPRCNYQARQLAHRVGMADAWVTFSPLDEYVARGGDPDHPRPVEALFESTPVELDDTKLLETAAGHLDQIDLVGTTEDLELIGQRAASFFGAPDRPVPRLNSTPAVARAEVSDRDRRRIGAQTGVDRELYERARRRARRE